MFTRIRNRLRSLRRPTGIGSGFDAARKAEWDELAEQVDAELQKAGSSVVAAWEVGAAELGRAVVGMEDDRQIIERFSDALVPTLQPFQDLHKGCATAMAVGARAGLASGRLDRATPPVFALVSGLGTRATDGWSRTSAHLSPVFARCARPEEARTRFTSADVALRHACDEGEAVLRARLGALPEAATLWDGLCGAVEDWQLVVTRGLEIAIDAEVKALAAGVKAGR